MAGNANETNQTRPLCFDERFKGAARAGNFVKFGEARDSVDLEQVEVINLQTLE